MSPDPIRLAYRIGERVNFGEPGIDVIIELVGGEFHGSCFLDSLEVVKADLERAKAAINAHDALIDALQWASEYLADEINPDGSANAEADALRRKIRAALELAQPPAPQKA